MCVCESSVKIEIKIVHSTQTKTLYHIGKQQKQQQDK